MEINIPIQRHEPKRRNSREWVNRLEAETEEGGFAAAAAAAAAASEE